MHLINCETSDVTELSVVAECPSQHKTTDRCLAIANSKVPKCSFEYLELNLYKELMWARPPPIKCNAWTRRSRLNSAGKAPEQLSPEMFTECPGVMLARYTVSPRRSRHKQYFTLLLQLPH